MDHFDHHSFHMDDTIHDDGDSLSCSLIRVIKTRKDNRKNLQKEVTITFFTCITKIYEIELIMKIYEIELLKLIKCISLFNYVRSIE